MRILIISAILLLGAHEAVAKASTSYRDMSVSADKALGQHNFFEARNQLAGALLKAVEQNAKSAEIIAIRTRLIGVYKRCHQSKTAAQLSKLPQGSLRAFAKKEYRPNVWYDAAGGVYNNVISKTPIIGIATMDKDGVIKAPLEGLGPSHAAGFMLLKPGDKDYDLMIKHLGGLNPGESKPIPAFK